MARSDQVPTLYLDPTKIMNGRDHASGSPPWKLSQADALYTKASSKPIQRGDKIRGILVFLFESFEPQDMNKQGTRYVLHCRDVNGKAVEADWTFRAMGDPHEYFPGLAPIPH